MDLEELRVWSENLKSLNEIILNPQKHTQAIQLFLSLHAWLHSSSVGNLSDLTLHDAVIKNLDEQTFRKYPLNLSDTKNSIAWHLWHSARLEDMTMSILVADDQQALYSGNWFETMNTRFTHSGNEMSEEEIAELSSSISFESLLAYKTAVGKQTRQIISMLKPGRFIDKVEQNRINRLFDENAVAQNASSLADYWSKRNIAWLVLMPATEHILIHLKKCIHIKEKLN
ncbi:hypothetical protein [Paenibacillus crassostreae]|uniref:DinB-like domain-containing protein n=1 Tax=Paenibacillus crassostreae TaxID=1763538 RepID=A0A167FFS5_9BACL|nr:hypothetical protein [Paenibacillus crassostreae]AOZ94448.1 hypothetical protein LPB68_21090 [Paenibacillus crassostreae]OAB76514.1 hypothetical protein PNBC_03650 [Paenibacillus crassostreae]